MKLSSNGLKSVAKFWATLAVLASYIGLGFYLATKYNGRVIGGIFTGVPFMIVVSIAIYSFQVEEDEKTAERVKERLNSPNRSDVLTKNWFSL